MKLENVTSTKYFVLVAALSAMSLVSCSKTEEPATQAPPPADAAASAPVQMPAPAEAPAAASAPAAPDQTSEPASSVTAEPK